MSEGNTLDSRAVAQLQQEKNERITELEAEVEALQQKVAAAELMWCMNAREDIPRAGLDGMWKAALSIDRESEQFANAMTASEADEAITDDCRPDDDDRLMS